MFSIYKESLGRYNQVGGKNIEKKDNVVILVRDVYSIVKIRAKQFQRDS